MSKKRFTLSILSLGLAATSLTCGDNHDRFTSYGSSPAMAGRVRYVKGAVSSYDQVKAQTNLAGALFSDRWVAIDGKDKPIPGTSLVFSPLPNRYRFYLELPDDADVYSPSILLIGETRVHNTPGDTTIRGQILSPSACSASRIVIGAVETDEKLGALLPVEFLDTCSLLPQYPETDVWYFQTDSAVAARLAPATKPAK